MIDVRDIDEIKIERAAEQIKAEIEQIAVKSNVQVSVRNPRYTPPVLCDEKIKSVIEQSFAGKGIQPFYLFSGAGPDGMQFSGVLPIGIVFVKSVNGISHSPLEYTEDRDVLTGADVLLETILNLDKDF